MSTTSPVWVFECDQQVCLFIQVIEKGAEGTLVAFPVDIDLRICTLTGH